MELADTHPSIVLDICCDMQQQRYGISDCIAIKTGRIAYSTYMKDTNTGTKELGGETEWTEPVVK